MSSDQPKFAVHGGAFFDAIGVRMDALDAKEEVISADVLDSWYDPSPSVIESVREHLPWLIKTSPPTRSEGLREVIAEKRGISPDQILLGSGTSSLMFLVLPELLNPDDKVVVLDPMYGEYAHLTGEIIGANVARHELPLDNFEADPEWLGQQCLGAKMLILVNPNSPTGRAMSRTQVQMLMQGVPPNCLVWIDETYIDFYTNASGKSQSCEELVAQFPNLIICKSMSKFYGLSGLRIGYLVMNPKLVRQFEERIPPWNVGLIAQLAGIEALKADPYYAKMASKTAEYRELLTQNLNAISEVQVIPSVTNFVLARLATPQAQELCDALQAKNIFIRNCDSLSPRFKNEMIRIAVKGDADQKVVSAIAEFFA
ncbi:MAG: histidinol-phosphate aminotransferase family protein [Armatimonadetes bacterium]|nr:histidinol-phosphate aminotransferase family protein [Armatimonadota bacterium]